ncbi:MAG TPA: HupE/UreJ family protein [Bryobacteraceae bacterium]|nr:HupE/UreJ family protein [Bryobacteraceae bacterium]
MKVPLLRPALLAALGALPAFAHVVSMSTGDLKIDDRRAHYELRMPLYEMSHVAGSEQSLFDHIRFSSGGAPARLVKKDCAANPAQGLYFCSVEYEFPTPVDSLDVECTFHAVTVANHVHLLRVVNGERRDQAIFDFSFPKATLRFRPPTPTEIAITEFGAGIMRAVGGLVQVLFLASLVLAARSRRELLAIGGMFLAGQVLSALIVPHTGWSPPSRFVEAAAALTLAYLAVEILLLPRAGGRWAIAGLLGAFHGLYFLVFLQSTGYGPGFVLLGAALAELALIALFAVVFDRLGRLATTLRPVQVSASALLVIGMVWFFLRLKN